MFGAFLNVHSSLVPLVLTVKTGKISPQYHVVFDDKFSTVNSLPSEDSIDKQRARIFKLGREFYLDAKYDENGNIATEHWPPLGDEWLDHVGRDCHILVHPSNPVPGVNVDRGGDTDPGGVSDTRPISHHTRYQQPSTGDEFETANFSAAHEWG